MTLSASGFVLLLPLAAFVAAAYALTIPKPVAAASTDAGTSPFPRAHLILVSCLVSLMFLASLQLDLALSVDTDDAPITFRYAENIAAGRGFVYNEGERILGTSTPLFTLILAGLRLVGIPIETAALLLSLASVAALMGLLSRIGRSLGLPGAGLLAAALVCVEAPFLVYATQGMETTFYAALILGTFVCHLEGRENSAAVLAALCVLMRLDGLAVPLALAVSYAVEKRRPTFTALALFTTLCAPWFLFSEMYFGHILPQSMVAKLAHPKSAGRWWMLRYLFLEENLLFVPFGLIGAVLVCIGPRAGRKLVLPAWLAIYGAAFSIVSIDAYPWYRIPLVPLMSLLAAVGLCLTFAGLLSLWPRTSQRVAVVAVFLTVAPFGVRHYIAYRDSLAEYSEQLRVWERPRIAAAEWLRDHAMPGSSVAAAGIGHIGWISGLRVLDTAGLVSPRLLNGFDPSRDKPDFVVGHDEDSVFRVGDDHYQLVKSLAVDQAVVYRIYERTGTRLR